MHGIYISMDTAALTSPQGAVVRGIIGQRATYRAYRAYRALFCGSQLLLRPGKLPGNRRFVGPLGDLMRLGERLLDKRLKSQESPRLAPACTLPMHD
jgi:hypothetical protein